MNFFSSPIAILAGTSYASTSHTFNRAVVASYNNVYKYGCVVTDDAIIVRQARRELVFCLRNPSKQLFPGKVPKLVFTEQGGFFKGATKEVVYDLEELFTAPSGPIARGIKFAQRNGVEIQDYREPDDRLNNVYARWKLGKETDGKTYLMAFNPARYLRTYSLAAHGYDIYQKMISIYNTPYGFINFALDGARAFELSFISRFREPELRLINDQNDCIIIHCLHDLYCNHGVREVNLGTAAGIKGLRTFKHKLPHREVLVYCGKC